MDLALASTVGLAVIWVPGAVATRVLRTGSRDPLIRFAHECALGLSFWPILFLFTSSVGLSWSAFGATVLLLVAGCSLLAAARRLRTPRARLDSLAGWGLALAAIVGLTRVRQIHDVALPIWVDSVHHTMIVRLFVDHGRLPASYAPFIPDGAFFYHWGFHAVTAFAAWVSGMTSPGEIPRLLLAFGQLLNVLVFFAVYTAAVSLFRSRRTALLAATLATLVSLFPAYYVSWGRYTQLCGVLILTPLASSFWRLGRHPDRRRAIEVALLAGGLLLIHVRVAILFAIVANILVCVLCVQRHWKGLAWCAASGLAAVLVASPWLVQLVRTPQVRTILAPAAEERGQWETSNAAPDDLLWAPHNDVLFALGSGGLLGLAPFPLRGAVRIAAIGWWLLLIVLLQRRAKRKRGGIDRRDAWRMAILVAWVAITALLINLDRIGLPRLRILPNSAAIILLFLPVSLAAAHLIRFLCDEIVAMKHRRRAMIGATLVIGIGGAWAMRDIVNPTTVLATAADRRALEWIHTHTRPESQFAVGVQPWIGGSYIGVDGGYWIPLIAERRAILPPGLYRWVMPPNRVEDLTQLLRDWHQAEEVGDLRLLAELRRRGVTHLYFGPRNTTTLRSAVTASSDLTRVYSFEGVEIFALR